jgi:hypothetical protein
LVFVTAGRALLARVSSAARIEVGDLLPGFVRVDEGGVLRLARLQAEGLCLSAAVKRAAKIKPSSGPRPALRQIENR